MSPSVAQSFSVTLSATPSFPFLLPRSLSLPLSASLPLFPSLALFPPPFILPVTHFSSLPLILAFHPLTVLSLSPSLSTSDRPPFPLSLLAPIVPCSPFLFFPWEASPSIPTPGSCWQTPSASLPSRTCPGDEGGRTTHQWEVRAGDQMEEALWADVATAGLGGGPGRKQSGRGQCAGIPAKGCSGGSWGLCKEKGQQNDNQLGSKEGIPHPTDSSRIWESLQGSVGAGSSQMHRAAWPPPLMRRLS
ncbi:hypothetical protein D623_10017540 [Myotis brandtii]|uniref:Uncharacterized protein n=1 Tax=Myotis brandtii TaxID=109478 RepID=S7NLE2_MYOBR|nr:hypothetical protein D623_10017540 [Myotis brandtii]